MVIEEMAEVDNLRVAIVGKGLVAAVTALALSKLPNVTVSVFELDGSECLEPVWTRVTLSALIVLEKLGIKLSEIDKLLYRSNGKLNIHDAYTNKFLRSVSSSSYVRDEFLPGVALESQLLHLIQDLLPEQHVEHYKKTGIKEVRSFDNRVFIDFSDETSVINDLLIITDPTLFNEPAHQSLFNYPQSDVKNRKIYYQNILPQHLVNDVSGIPDALTLWLGNDDKAVVLTSRLGPEQFGVNVVLSDNKQVKFESRAEVLRRVEEAFRDWNPKLKRLIGHSPSYVASSQIYHEWPEEITKHSRVVYTGRAAHPVSNGHVIDFPLGVGDAWALYLALKHTALENKSGSSYVYDTFLALFYYSETRRKFLNTVKKTTNRINNPDGHTTTMEKEIYLKNNKYGRWITENDVEKDFKDVSDLNVENIINRKL